MRRAILIDAIVAASLVALGMSVGGFASRHFEGQPIFYQSEFGPAVMVAVGRGFVNPVVTPGSPLAGFLEVKRGWLDTYDVTDVTLMDRDPFQEATRYLMLAIGYMWRFTGISWAALSGVAAVLYALSVVASYAICRIWVSRTLAVLGALFMCFSPLQLAQVAHIRDYSKAPFMLLAILLLVLVCTRPWSRRLLVLLSAACGVITGVGLGFKMDVVVMVPIFLAGLLMFRDRWPWSGLADKALAAGAFVVALTVAAAPVLVHLSAGGTNGYHVILLGYSDSFDDSLVVNRSVYSFLPFYDDGYATAAIQSYGARTSGQIPSMPSPAYDAAGRAYWLTIVRHFPADVATRVLAATNAVLNIPFSEPPLNFLSAPQSRSSLPWNLLTNQPQHRARISALYDWLSALNGWGVLFGIVLVGAGSVYTMRAGLFAATMVLALSGYSSLQFADRHYFYLEIVPVLGAVLTINLLINAARQRPGWRVVRRFTASSVVLVVALVTSVTLLRSYQRHHLRSVFQQYRDAPKQSVEPVFEDQGNGIWRAHWRTMSGRRSPDGSTSAEYYVVEFDGTAVQEMSLFDFRYRSVSPQSEFWPVVSMPAGAGVNQLFVPAYSQLHAWELESIEFPDAVRNRLRGIYRVSHPEQLPLLLALRLSGDWQRGSLNQTLRFETEDIPDRIRVLGDATGSSGSRLALVVRTDLVDVKPAPAEVAQTYSDAVHVSANGVEMDGLARAQSSYLLQFKPLDVRAPAKLLVRGHLFSGGLAFGLLKNERWYRELTIAAPGSFIAVIDISESGTYTPLITNATMRDREQNRFILSRFGVVASNPARP